MRFVLVLLALLVPSAASAQRLLAHDTLSMETPSAVSCGFCQDEVIGVVFRELSGIGGIRPEDFPLGLTNVQVALADATTDGTTCSPRTTGGEITAEVEVWAGPTPPSALPAAGVVFGMPWPDETLVWANAEVPITLSTPTTDGGTMFNLQFNALLVTDELGMPVVVPAGNAYLRVAVRLPGAGSFNSVCVDPVEQPAGFPLRDNDGRLTDQRSFIYAGGGVGWLWNETAGLNGDWAIRLEVAPMGSPRDAGTRDAGGSDAGTADSGAFDGGTDAGTAPASGGCRASAGGSPSAWLVALAALALTIIRRKT